GLVLALGDAGFLFRVTRSVIPVISLGRYPVKFMVLFLAVAPLLAAFGLKNLTARGKLGRFEWVTGLALLLLTGAIIAFDHSSPRDEWSTSWKVGLQNGVLRSVFFVLLMGFTALLAGFNARRQTPPSAISMGEGRGKGFCSLLLLAIFWLDLITHLPKQNPTVPASAFAPGLARTNLNWTFDPAL